jgi:hypothetical protein
MAHMGDNYTMSLQVNLKNSDHFKDLDIDGRILTCITNTQDVKMDSTG